MKHLKKPTKRENQKVILWQQKAFRRTYRDTPASEISNNSLADTINMLPFDTRARVRHGTREFFGASLPAIVGRTDYDVTKSSNTITKTVGEDFTSDDIGNYFVWPTGTADLIVGITDVDNITVEDSTSQTATAAGKVRARINGKFFHRKEKRIYLHLGTEIFFTTSDFTTYTEVIQASGTSLSNKKSTFNENRGDVYMSTEDGHFRIDTSATRFYLIQINLDNKINGILPDTQSIEDHFARRYLYTFTRMDGSYFGDRETPNTIIKESGPNLVDPETGVDYKEIFYQNEIRVNPLDSTDFETYNNGGVYTTVKGDFLDQSLSFFQALTNAGVYAQFIVGGAVVKKEVRFNLSTAVTFDDLAFIIQTAIRGAFPDMDGEAEVVVNAGDTGIFLEFNGGSYDGSHAKPFLTNKVSGTTDSTSSSTLIDSSATFITDVVNVGDRVNNLDDGTNAFVTSVDSETQLTITSDIFTANGTSYEVKIPTDIGADLKLDTATYKNNASLGTIDTEDAEHVGYGGQTGAFTPNSNQESQWTHTSVYGTVDTLVATNNVAQYAWLFDRPLIKSFVGGADNDGLVTVTDGTFSLEDVGQVLVFDDGTLTSSIKKYVSTTVVRVVSPVVGETSAVSASTLQDSVNLIFVVGDIGKTVVNSATGSSAVITSFTSSSIVGISSDIFTEVGIRYEFYQTTIGGAISTGTPMSLGGDNGYLFSQSTTTVTATSKTPFSSTDVGRQIFWSDGAISLITAFLTTSTVTVADSTTRSSIGAAFQFTNNGIGFNDTIPDDLLIDRISDNSLRNRFWTALPAGRFSAFSPGFYFTASQGDSIGYYSQLSQSFEYLGGHHYAPFQNFPIEDRIEGLEAFPEQAIVYGSRSTWRINTNTSNIVTIPEVGEAIALISGVALADADIGIIHDGGIQTIEKGQQIVITSEPGVRIFDGFNYTENLAIDENGRPMFLKNLEDLHKIYASAYDSVMGFIFWAAQKDVNIETFFTEDIVPLTLCYRVGVRQEQARGWGELDGTDWIFSNSRVGGLTVFTDNDVKKLVLFDEGGDGKPFHLDKTVFTDKKPSETEGTEITWTIKFKEHKASREAWQIRHLISHFYVRPQFEDERDASNHDSEGYRTSQVITANIYKDGELTAHSTIDEVPFQGEVSFDVQTTANRIQLELTGTASELQIVEHDTDYVVEDTRAIPSRRNLNWGEYQKSLGNVSFWIGRVP